MRKDLFGFFSPFFDAFFKGFLINPGLAKIIDLQHFLNLLSAQLWKLIRDMVPINSSSFCRFSVGSADGFGTTTWPEQDGQRTTVPAFRRDMPIN